ncbi:MAG: glycosyltransferase family 2 protein [Methylococcales bacterium]|nr:glycosyltransferase family 2 protein [Methylococcales bacterium]
MVELESTKFDYDALYCIKSDTPLVTVLICNYNYERYLSTAIDSVLAQTWQFIEVIVVDDGSTDGSRRILERYQDNVRVILKENGGQASGFNVGIKEAQGAIMCFLDSDDFWYPQKVEKIVSKYHEAPWGLICHDLMEVDAHGNQTNGKTHAESTKCPLLSGNLLDLMLARGYRWVFSPTSGMSLPTQIAREIIPIPENEWRICADNPLAYGAICHAPVGVIDNPLGAYRLHGVNGFAFIRKDGIAQSLYNFTASVERYFFLRDYVSRIRHDIELIDPLNGYRFFRKFCFIVIEKPWGQLLKLWKLNIQYCLDPLIHLNMKWYVLLKYLCIDTLLVALMFLRIPTPYKTVRTCFREHRTFMNVRLKKYLQ